MVNDKLIIDKLLTIDNNGMPAAPNIRELLDSDVRKLYERDKTKDKSNYIRDCIIIYYLGDPKSPAKQAGLSDKEALKMACEQAGVKVQVPDMLVLKLVKKYYEQNITEAGRVVENITKGLHNINIAIEAMNDILNQKLSKKAELDITTMGEVLNLVDAVNKKAGELPSIMKKLEEAKQNLLYEKETELARGGGAVSSSMDASNY
jgi:hypothetical protein